MSELSRDVVITSGGTCEKIDDVRYISNFSSGRLGHELASAYSQLGHQVLLLAPLSVIDRFGTIDLVDHRSFTSAEDLRKELLAIPSARLVLHAAAVSDYTPEKVQGKISSDQEELIIHLKRNPKILAELRQHFGQSAKIVGFKLLSGVTEAELIKAAVNQINTNDTDLCIANDLQEIKDGRRVHIVQPSGDYQSLQGSTSYVARELASKIGVPDEPLK